MINSLTGKALKTEQRCDWLSMHIYYEGDLSAMLRNCIAPLLHNNIVLRHIGNFFFIRYFELGKHLRLRLRVDINHKEYVYSYSVARISSYIAKYPSVNIGRAIDWPPNNSIQVLDYVPEVWRYGGSYGLHFAEEHFRHSSEIILKYLCKSKQWDYNNSLNTAIKLHVILITCAFKNDLDTAILVLKTIWSKRSMVAFRSQNNLDLNRLESQYFGRYLKDKILFAPFIVKLIHGVYENIDYTDNILNEWKKDTHYFVESITHLISANKLLNLEGICKNMREAESIIESCMHMTNNRLAIHISDEGYLYYLIMNSLIEIREDGKYK